MLTDIPTATSFKMLFFHLTHLNPNKKTRTQSFLWMEEICHLHNHFITFFLLFAMRFSKIQRRKKKKKIITENIYYTFLFVIFCYAIAWHCSDYFHSTGSWGHFRIWKTNRNNGVSVKGYNQCFEIDLI